MNISESIDTKIDIEIKSDNNNNSDIDSKENNFDFYNINGNWENPEKYTIILLIVNLIIVFLLAIIGYTYNIDEIKLEDNTTWYLEFCKLLISGVLFLHGLFRHVFKNIEVQYTRKTFHVITQLLLPLLAYKTYRDRQSRTNDNNIVYYSLYQSLWSSLFINAGLLIMIKPIRKINNILGYFSRISFLSIDRIEDRPYTLLWLMSQISAVSFIECPMTIWFIHKNMFHLFWIPIFASGLGDGLAEIIGKKWGKHKYEIISLFSNKVYTRSIEGSLCVYFFTFIGIIIGYNYYNFYQLVYSLLVIPISTTITEAIAPHTWDNHFIFGIIWLNLWIVFDIL